MKTPRKLTLLAWALGTVAGLGRPQAQAAPTCCPDVTSEGKTIFGPEITRELTVLSWGGKPAGAVAPKIKSTSGVARQTIREIGHAHVRNLDAQVEGNRVLITGQADLKGVPGGVGYFRLRLVSRSTSGRQIIAERAYIGHAVALDSAQHRQDEFAQVLELPSGRYTAYLEVWRVVGDQPPAQLAGHAESFVVP